MRFSAKLIKLDFVIYPARYHTKEGYMLIKLGKSENKHIIGYKPCQKPMPLLI